MSKEIKGKDIITSFVIGATQFIIGVFLIVGKANLTTIGWYYIFASSLLVLASIVSALIKANK